MVVSPKSQLLKISARVYFFATYPDRENEILRFQLKAAMIEVDRLSSIPLVVAAAPGCCAYNACLNVQNVCAVAAGKPRASATTRRVATFGAQTAETDVRRSSLLGIA